ncbi:polysaccharide biosynthesis protein [Halobacillus fulvus]|nr:polysaccharide biosynthesis protein [Halobacillus fulvus]
MITAYKVRLLLLASTDFLFIAMSVYVTYILLDTSIFGGEWLLLSTIGLLFLFHHLYSFTFRMHKKKWRYAGMEDLMGLLLIGSLSVGSLAMVQFLIGNEWLPQFLIVLWLIYVLAIGGSRIFWRYYHTYGWKKIWQGKKGSREGGDQPASQRTLIVGAGAAGRMLVKEIKASKDLETTIVGFVDDDPRTHRLTINGCPVLGATNLIDKLVKENNINHIVIAMPSISRKRLGAIINEAKAVVQNVQTLPMIEDIAFGKVSVSQIRDVQIEDLLGRDPVELDLHAIESEIRGQTVLVTGAGGSIGSEICRQIVQFQPERLILLGHGENSIYSIHMELTQLKVATAFIPVIADVQDRKRICEVIEEYRPAYIYHAAAHKHVPLMEGNPKEAVKNNVVGTKNVAEAADMFGVNTFVLVSTDKAVNPPNVMGATKRLAEMIVQSLSRVSSTKFVAVRFGNVLGSRGSVIPLFKQQIARGGPVTVTHPDMTRYFMTIPEASRLVLQAGALANGGEIFVLDMNEPVKIVDLAKNLIHLSGFKEDEIGIEYTGIRPGEKLYEELLSEKEVHREPVFPNILIGKTVEFSQESLYTFIQYFESLSEEDVKRYAIELANSQVPFNLIAK